MDGTRLDDSGSLAASGSAKILISARNRLVPTHPEPSASVCVPEKRRSRSYGRVL
jgi:hypothetical protein